MVIHTCPTCKKDFNKKSTYAYHIENKKKPCLTKPIFDPPKTAKASPKTAKLTPKTAKNRQINAENLLIASDALKNTEKMIDLLFKETIIDDVNKHDVVCMYCEKNFTRTDSLRKHQKGRCKSKVNHDELEILKEKMNVIIVNYQNLENNYQYLENNYQNLENNYQQLIKTNNNEEKIISNTTNKKIININNGNNNSNNNNNNNNINNGIINTINIVQFGEEDINKINLPEAVKQYLTSTGGNIASNMLKYINLNEKYPENHNICISDISRELVKIHNGKKFITKKFKNVKNDIMKNVVKNTRKIMDNYEKDDKIKKSNDTKTKLKINDISLKLIDGISGEEIVRDEIKENEKIVNYKNNSNKYKINTSENDDYESEEERDFTLDERLRIEHLDKKREGLQIKSFENLKEELYNARELLIEI